LIGIRAMIFVIVLKISKTGHNGDGDLRMGAMRINV
jgi:hypothetical protein